MDNKSTINTNKTQPVSAQFANGWLDGLDGRLGIARELRQRFQALTDDLGGTSSLSYAERSLCERALWLEYWLSTQEKELADGGALFDVGKWTQAANSLQGIYSKLGLKRVAKNVPTLHEWMAAREPAK